MLLRALTMPGGRQKDEVPLGRETSALVAEMFGVPKPQQQEGPDFSDRYNTKLAPAEEKAFQGWLGDLSKAKGYDAKADLRDYDLRGAFKSGVTADERGHLTDEFKKPNHPTFSSESIYSGKDGFTGGQWVGDDQSGWNYQASPTNLKFRTPEQLQQYFQRVEPNSQLMLPPAPSQLRPDEQAAIADRKAREAHRQIVGY